MDVRWFPHFRETSYFSKKKGWFGLEGDSEMQSTVGEDLLLEQDQQ